MEKSMNAKQLFCLYIAFLRSLYLIHQNHHWTCKGSGSYSNHLLFERIYASAQEDADSAAEEFVGLFGNEELTLSNQTTCMKSILEKFASDNDFIKTSLLAEQGFLKLSKELRQKMNDEELTTEGFDDVTSAIASSREKAVYLLKQNMA
jgi:DNA-binding ferritin-like protein